MYKYLEKSFCVFLTQPSAILVGIEDVDLLICEINPKSSSFGKHLVTL